MVTHVISRTVYGISIHAPARGATLNAAYKYNGEVISIHAPARGATEDPIYLYAGGKYFNPRSREGSDCISVLTIFHIPRYFNPRSREGSDSMDCSSVSNYRISIHAPARGATLVDKIHTMTQPFQSTLPRGERHITLDVKINSSMISIHAPARGATAWLPGVSRPPPHFNPRSREGSD